MIRELPPTALKAVVMGASAGAVETLLNILPLLPENYPLPIIIVVHVPPDRDSTLAVLLNARCQIAVKEAEDKESIQSSSVYIAPPGYHLLVEPELTLSLSKDEVVNYSRPSIDVLFESAADAFGNEVAGMILTGANSDGARGLHAVYEAGGIAIVQSPDSAIADAMPLAALRACPNAYAMSPHQIANTLIFEFTRGLR